MSREANRGFEPIFTRLKAALATYQGRLEVRSDEPNRYELWSTKVIEIPVGPHGYGKEAGPGVSMRKRKGVMFAAVIIQKRWVGLYLNPVYADPALKESIDPRLLSLMAGKSCFHIKELEDELLAAIREALALGWSTWEEKGWV